MTGNRSRDRRLGELQALRRRVLELETQLEAMRQGPLQGPGAEQGPPAARDDAERIWRPCAERQRAERRRAEAENARLRAALAEQLQVARRLERMRLVKRPSALIEDATDTPDRKHLRRWLKAPDEGILNELRADLSVILDRMRVDMARESLAMTTPSTPPRDRRDIALRSTESAGSHVVVVEELRLPFDVDACAAAAWRFFARYPNANATCKAKIEHESQVLDVTDHEITRVFGETFAIPRFEATFWSNLTARRHDTATTEIVLVWAALGEPIQVLGTPMEGLKMRHQGWIRLTTAPVTPTESARATQLQSYHTIVPEVHDTVAQQTHKIGLLTNYTVHTIGVQVEAARQAMENDLFSMAISAAIPNDQS